MDQIDELILAETPREAEAIAIIDAPTLVAAALEITEDVRVWCDDVREARTVPEELLVAHPTELAGVDLAWGHLPQALAALDEQAASIQGAADVTFLTGGRQRHMNRTMNEVLAKHFVAVNATRGHKKSRALRAWGPNNLPTEFPKLRRRPEVDLVIAAHGATFAGNKVDAGTRLLLQHLDVPGTDVLDFGSGNGVISAVLARAGHRVHARDVSWSAVAATAETALANNLTLEISWADGLEELEDESFDAIVTNPPFHQGVAKESTPTLQMFDDARRVLRPGGQLWCVYNSHLPYRKELNARLGRTSVVAQDRNYTLTLTQL